jgi:hypothetical protein
MLIEQTQAELNAAQVIQSGCTLMRVVLAKSSVEAFGTEEQFPGPLKLKFTHEATSALNGQVLTVMAHFDFKSFVASDDIVPVFDLACTFQLAYELQENCKPTPQQVDAFKKGNAVLQLLAIRTRVRSKPHGPDGIPTPAVAIVTREG